MFCITDRPSLLHRLLPLPLVIVALFCFTGCLTFEVLIKVNPDGTGTVERSFIITNQMIRMAFMFGGDDGEPVALCDAEEDLLEQADAMGEGVELLSVERVQNEGELGCRTIFTFTDINTLRVSFDPETQMPKELMDDEEETLYQQETDPDETVYVTFRHDPDDPPTLVTMLNQQYMFGGEAGEDMEENPFDDLLAMDSTQRAMQLQMMREMTKDGFLTLALEVENDIAETNATYHEGNRITLFEMDFYKLFESEEKLLQLQRIANANPQSADELKALIDSIDGFSLETLEEVHVPLE